jgi:hypothetical protein
MESLTAFSPSLSDSLETIRRIPVHDDAYLLWAYFFMLRLSFEPLRSFGIFMIEHYHMIQRHIRAVVKFTAVHSRLDNAIANQIDLAILTRLYELIHRFKLRTFSPQFVRDTATVLTFFAHIPVLEGGFLLYDVRTAYDAVAQTVTSAPVFSRFSRFLFLSDHIGYAVMASLIPFELPTIRTIASALLESDMRPAFLATLRMCLNSVTIPGLAQILSDMYFEFLVAKESGPMSTHRITHSHFLFAELVLSSAQFRSEFVQTAAYSAIIDSSRQFLAQLAFETNRWGIALFESFLYFLMQLFRTVRDPGLQPPPLEMAFKKAGGFPDRRTRVALYECAIAVSGCIGHFPYKVNWELLERSDADDYRCQMESPQPLPPVSVPALGTLPWRDWGVGSLAFFPHIPPVVKRDPERISKSQMIFANDWDGDPKAGHQEV